MNWIFIIEIIIIFRDQGPVSTDVSETNQDLIKNEEFDYIIDNNHSVKELKNQIEKISQKLTKGE